MKSIIENNAIAIISSINRFNYLKIDRSIKNT